jgi:DNA-binding GntR family transcriptional regulator
MSDVINKIIRFTLYPKSGNFDTIRDQHWNLIDLIMKRQKINAVRSMVNYIEMIRSVLYNLYYAPIIIMNVIQQGM